MVMQFYSLTTGKPLQEVLKEFERESPGFAVLLKPEFAAFASLVTYSILLSFKAFQEDRAKASTPELEAMLAESRERDKIEAPKQRITNLEAKVAKFKGHLADTEAALAAERAAQEGGI